MTQVQYDKHLVNSLDDQFTVNDSLPQLKRHYYVTDTTMTTGITKLMKYVLLSRKNPGLIKSITLQELYKQTGCGWTVLMLAAINSNTVSTNNTVELLLKSKADVNKHTR